MSDVERQEWLEALESLVEREGFERAQFILDALLEQSRALGVPVPFSATTSYRNTIPVGLEEKIPGDGKLEKRIHALVRWNAMAMVVRANRKHSELGGHIASYASSATLYDVGFNHFFRAPHENFGGDLLYIQGHSSPGIYARAYLEGRITASQLDGFRREVDGKGLSSYPHPWLMPDFWQFPTVSMGLGAITAIYQARFMKYLHDRELANTEDRKVWCFCGDGEMDEPESLGAISLAGREQLDNLVFVINCNLQRLDGPVRGNGKIIQELEGCFRGAGWNVIKVIWGGRWDALFAKDKNGLLLKRMEEACDGDYQNYKGFSGAYTREHFFGKYPELLEMVKDLTDDDIWNLNRGGHDPQKVYAAYAAAMKHRGQPTVILAKTVKGYGTGSEGEGKNVTHQLKKLSADTIRYIRDRFKIPVSDNQLEEVPFCHPGDDAPEIQYLKKRRATLGGALPARIAKGESIPAPALTEFSVLLESSGEREISTTMAFVRLLNILVKDKSFGERVVPIIPDEARTFGMEGMFRQLGIYSSTGQKYKPIDAGQVMYYKEDKKGQVLEEGITEAGAFSSWLAAATSYSCHQKTMLPFYIFYSMFGFQRIADLAWLAGDMQARGFLLGATAGRTTLSGEGLQHQDGHSHLIAATVPNCVSYDPTFGYELAVIIQDGMRRMFANQENVFYYITLMNENYQHPAMPKGAEAGILQGMYLLEKAKKPSKLHVQLMGSGTILREVLAARDLLVEFDVSADVWSVTSFNELRKEGLEVERWNRLHPEKPQKQSFVATALAKYAGPVIAATDYMKAYADQIRAFVPQRFVTLGTDGFGRSDTRETLRSFFEVNRYHVAVAALKALADEGHIKPKVVVDAMKKFGIDPEKPNPVKV